MNDFNKLIEKKLKEIEIHLENSDQHIKNYQKLLANDPQNSRYYQWETEREIDYKKHLNYQLESLKKLVLIEQKETDIRE